MFFGIIINSLLLTCEFSCLEFAHEVFTNIACTLVIQTCLWATECSIKVRVIDSTDSRCNIAMLVLYKILYEFCRYVLYHKAKLFGGNMYCHNLRRYWIDRGVQKAY